MTDSTTYRRSLNANGKSVDYFALNAAATSDQLARLPFSLKILLENLLRHSTAGVSKADIDALIHWDAQAQPTHEIDFTPARVILQDFTGVPAVVDLAAMRDAVKKMGSSPDKINPLSPVELVIDHSVMVDFYGQNDAFQKNVDMEFERNKERYQFLHWGQSAFENFRVVPPGTGIVHQVNLEYLARVIFTREVDGKTVAYPDTLVGTDSHTTMINGLGVLGWGVGGIEAEAAMLGQAIPMLIPQVVGFRLTGKLPEGATATDLVLMVVEMLRKKGVVGKFVEFFGDGLDHLPLADRATIANMAPEYGATCGIFPVDAETLNYLRLSGRDEDHIAFVEAYAKAQNLFRETGAPEADYSDILHLDLGEVTPSIAGPKRPQDRIALSESKSAFESLLKEKKEDPDTAVEVTYQGEKFSLKPGACVIAAITSCTNTSNPSVMIAAGLLAKKAHERGLRTKPWVKTSLAPGSQVVTDYFEKANLMPALEALGFNLVGYGCTTCIGNSGPLPDEISQAVDAGNLTVSAVLSGNRNFEGRIHPQVKAAYLASPPLVVAYALAGTMNIDLYKQPLGQDENGKDVFLKDLWPSQIEIQELVHKTIGGDLFKKRYQDVFKGDETWQNLGAQATDLYGWDDASTYVQNPPYFVNMTQTPSDINDVKDARVLCLLGDSVTTDHISPAGAIAPDSPAGEYLISQGVRVRDFNSYGSRRGNHEVMMRGTFANVRLRNLLAPGTEGGWTRYQPSGEQMRIFDASMKYQEANVPLIILAGSEYGTGSSRDWAAKGTRLLGVKTVIAESFERIHRSNLIGMGVLPLQFVNGENANTLGLDGSETFDIPLASVQPRNEITITAKHANGETKSFQALVRIDTPKELTYFENGGILHYVIRQLAA